MFEREDRTRASEMNGSSWHERDSESEHEKYNRIAFSPQVYGAVKRTFPSLQALASAKSMSQTL